MTIPVTHRYFTTGAARIHALDYGGNGPTVVCVHGVTSHAWAWHDVAQELVKDYHVLAVDLRGHGDSQWATEDKYATEEHADDLIRVLKDLESPPAALVGASWGALIALRTSLRSPERVRCLALVDIEPSFNQVETDVPDRPQVFTHHDDIVDWEANASPGAPDTMVRLMSEHGVRPAAGGTFVRKHDPLFARRWPFRADDHWASLPEVRVPTLAVHAGKTFVRSDAIAQMVAQIPDAHLVEIPESTHVVPVDAPKRLATELAAFLASSGNLR